MSQTTESTHNNHRGHTMKSTYLRILLLGAVSTHFWSGLSLEAAPTVDSVLAPLIERRNAFLSQDSFGLEFQVKSNVFSPGSFSYRSYTVTYLQQGVDFKVTVEFPEGSLLSNPEFPERFEERGYYKGVAFERDSYSTNLTPAPLTQHFGFRDYTDYLHLNVYKGIPMPPGNVRPFEISQPFIPESVLQHKAQYAVRRQPEEISDVLCQVLERPGVDVIWVDDHGLLRRRELRWAQDEPTSVITTFNNYYAVSDGLWLPKQIIAAHFLDPVSNRDSDPSARAYELEITLVSASFNNLTEEQLVMTELRPGTRVTDYVRGVKYVVPEPGELPFEQAIQIAQGEGRPGRWLLYLNALAIIIILYILVGRRIVLLVKKRRSGGPH